MSIRRATAAESPAVTALVQRAYARAGYAETDRRTEAGFDRVFMAKRVV